MYVDVRKFKLNSRSKCVNKKIFKSIFVIEVVGSHKQSILSNKHFQIM